METKETCPKCKSPCIKGTEYCICGYKWSLMGPIEAMFAGMGIDLEDMKRNYDLEPLPQYPYRLQSIPQRRKV